MDYWGGGGRRGQRVCWWPPSKIIGWAFPLPPPLFHIEIEGKCGWIIGEEGGGGGKGYVGGPPLKLLGGPLPPPFFLRQFIDTLLSCNYTQADKMKTMF